jgi:hypothetical protein
MAQQQRHPQPSSPSSSSPSRQPQQEQSGQGSQGDDLQRRPPQDQVPRETPRDDRNSYSGGRTGNA